MTYHDCDASAQHDVDSALRTFDDDLHKFEDALVLLLVGRVFFISFVDFGAPPNLARRQNSSIDDITYSPLS